MQKIFELDELKHFLDELANIYRLEEQTGINREMTRVNADYVDFFKETEGYLKDGT